MALHVLDEANRCLGCKKPMCQEGCPIHTNIPEVIRLLKANQMDDAGRMLFENNPLTTVCSLVCNHEKQCEGHCIRNRMPSHDPVHFSIIEDYISTTYANKMVAGPAPKNGMKTVPDMKALVHYVASVWDSETEENSQSTVEIIMAYIAEHLENELRREELAEAVHLNPDYMARLFKKETGMNLKDYIIQQKMQEAQSLLCTTNLPISLIAAKVGYTNFGHFSTSYKKFYHKTPQEERSAAL